MRRQERTGRALLALCAGAVGLLLALTPDLAAASSPAGAQLTGTFAIVLKATAPKSFVGHTYRVGWSFTPECDSGACDVQVDTVASSCVSGSCAEPPSQFSFAGDQLSLTHGVYQGTFSVKTDCTTNGNDYPYGYNQHTNLSLHPTAAASVGTIGTTPVRHVSALSGTLTLKEVSTGTRGCGTFTEKYKVHGNVSR
jgi:hypothetical protein